MKRVHQPPQFLLRFFRWYCHPALRSHIEGDLTELFQERVDEVGRRKATVKFMVDVLLLFRPGIVRPMASYRNVNTQDMLKNNIKIAWRNLAKGPTANPEMFISE
jgi:hypothetical protein